MARERAAALPGGAVPWWPGHEPPADVQRTTGAAPDWVLAQVEPAHWVGLWRTPAALALPAPPPDLAFTR